MSTTKAIVVLPEERAADIRMVPVPRIRDDWTLVRVRAMALNPTDWKHIDYGYANAGARIGCEYAGVVTEVGANVSSVKVGDRVAGFCHGGHRSDHETGAFGEYILGKACGQIKMLADMSFEQAATLPISTFTCGLGLYKSLGLPPPDRPAKEPFPILIHGGSTSTGMRAIQFAKASGLTVIATASPHNFNYLKSLGVDAVFNYKSATCGPEIKSYTKNKLRYAWDCVGGGETLCCQALSDVEPSKYGAINASNAPDPDLLKRTNQTVEGPFFVLAYNILNEEYKWQDQMILPPIDEMEFAQSFKQLTLGLFEKGKLGFVKISLNRGGSGLEGVMVGLDEMRAGKVSGEKLVYTF